MLNQIEQDSYENPQNANTVNLIRSFYKIRKSQAPHLIPKIITRDLTQFEINFLNIDIYFANINVKASHRVYCNNISYHSTEYKVKSRNKCNYIVKYRTNKYGEIKYFLEYDGIFYVAILKYQKVDKTLFSDILLERPHDLTDLLNLGVFNFYFYFMEKTAEMEIINLSEIENKCIIKFKCCEENPNLFTITEYLNENEHD